MKYYGLPLGLSHKKRSICLTFPTHFHSEKMGMLSLCLPCGWPTESMHYLIFLWALARLKLEFGSYWHIFSNHFTYKIHNEIIQQKQTKQCQGNVLNDNKVRKKEGLISSSSICVQICKNWRHWLKFQVGRMVCKRRTEE